MIPTLRRRLERGDDSGFSLAEVLVAMVVISVGLLGLLAVQTKALSTVAQSKERQTATAFAERAMEQLRAIPYTALEGGLQCAQLAGDPNVTVVNPSGSCTATFNPTYDTSISGESVVVTTSGSVVAPLAPHQPADAAPINGATFRVRNYVTRVNNDPAIDAGYWLTVVSMWRSGNTKNAWKSIALRSQVYSPDGCLSPTTHPFSGPCQAFFYSDAGIVGGAITVDANRGGALPLVDGMAVTSGSVAFPNVSGRTQYEQSLSTQALFATTSAQLVEGATTTKSGGVGGTSSADTDPATGTASNPSSATTGLQSGSALTATGGGTRLDVTPAPSDTGSAYATTAATSAPACVDDSNASVGGSRNCATAQLTPGGTSAIALTLNSLGARGMTLADVAPAATASRAFGARFPTASSAPAHCTATSGVGCVAAGARRYLGTVRVGGLASRNAGDTLVDGAGTDRSAALGTSSLVSLTSYNDAAYAESGIAAGASSLTRSGSLSYWNGTGFTSVALGSATAGTYSVPLVVAGYGTTTVRVSGTVTVTAASSPATGTSPCVTAACSVKSTSGTIRVNLSYAIFSGATQVGGFTVNADLGSALAHTTYKGAPSA